MSYLGQFGMQTLTHVYDILALFLGLLTPYKKMIVRVRGISIRTYRAFLTQLWKKYILL